MFRDKMKSNIDPTHFGVGSTIAEDIKPLWLVVGYGHNGVTLMDLKTFEIKTVKAIEVEDPNFMTSDETRKLVSAMLHGTFSDYTFNPKGLKG